MSDRNDRTSGEKCPRCGSPDPKRHPAMQHEGEVQMCCHPFHTQPPPPPLAVGQEVWVRAKIEIFRNKDAICICFEDIDGDSVRGWVEASALRRGEE